MRAFHLASAAEDPAAQVELLESLSWTYTELGYPQRAIECMMLLCQLHEQRDEAEALVSTLVALSSLHLMVGEADEALACLERALDDAQAKLPANLHLHLACISPVSRLHLPCIFPASRLHLACISPVSPRRRSCPPTCRCVPR